MARVATTTRAAAALMGLAACAPRPQPGPEPEGGVPPEFPVAVYRRAHAAGAAVYCLDPGGSRVVVRVYRAGPLARLGHDHVVSTRAVHGYVLLAADPERSRADLFIPVDGLEVDDPRLRARAGFDAALSEADIAATRRNMLHSVLESGRYPYVRAQVRWASPPGAAEPRAAMELMLHGVTQRRVRPVGFHRASGELHATGTLAVVQTDFGITPFSALGGALKVADRVDVRFDLRARPMGAGGRCPSGTRPGGLTPG